MGLAHEKKSYLQEKANLFEIGSNIKQRGMITILSTMILETMGILRLHNAILKENKLSF